jgi:hypothetical protein
MDKWGEFYTDVKPSVSFSHQEEDGRVIRSACMFNVLERERIGDDHRGDVVYQREYCVHAKDRVVVMEQTGVLK